MPEAMAAVEAVAPALEIIDSRFENFKFSLPDVIADNASSSGYVVGPWAEPEMSFDNLGIMMSINGEPRQMGSTAAILGNPMRSLVHAARLAADAGQPLQAGWVVMAGAATAAEYLRPADQVSAEFQNLGFVTFSVSRELLCGTCCWPYLLVSRRSVVRSRSANTSPCLLLPGARSAMQDTAEMFSGCPFH